MGFVNSGAKQGYTLNDNCYIKDDNIIIKNGVTNLGDYAFYNCSDIKSVTFPNGLKDIGTSCFEGCTGLTTVNITPVNTETFYVGNGLLEQGKTFKNCTNLQTLKINNSIAAIHFYADCFLNCTKLTNLITNDDILPHYIDLKSCPLSHDTILQFFYNLQLTTGGIFDKVTLGATNLAKMTSQEKAIATNKGWTLS